MLTKAFVTAAAAGLLMTSAAYAGDSDTHMSSDSQTQGANAATTVNPSSSAPMDSGTSAMSADTSSATSDVSATVPMSASDALAAGGTVQITTSTPVADTPENRALYGQPLSNTGKRTTPSGN